ncbi:MAG: sulfite reductase subunit alpha [Achromobacter xylosoxidans]
MTSRWIAAACVVLAWLLLCGWAWRRARRRQAQAAQALRDLDAPQADDAILVAYASQTGQAEALAAQTAQSLWTGGLAVRVAPLAQLDGARLAASGRILFIASTYGEGDAPDAAAAFASQTMQAATPPLDGLRYAVLALGDSDYAHFCGFGRRLDEWLRQQGATPLFDRVEVDGGDPADLRHWQHHLGLLAGRADLPDWETPAHEAWRLAGRELLNPGSEGGPCYLLTLAPPASGAPVWLAGDIAEIGPRLARGGALQPHREYSIASLPADGVLQLLVRQMRKPDGTLGVGSGWLTHIAQPGDSIALRIRGNRNFHAPVDGRPMILIGNGTGLAGLRALIKARRAAGHERNWLVFGERHAAHDNFCGDEIAAWRQDGTLARVDSVYSRDQPGRRYVQHCLLEQAADVRAWIDEGAAIYVCGSLQGMAGGVDAALRDILGAERLQALQHDGRYRRDVY